MVNPRLYRETRIGSTPTVVKVFLDLYQKIEEMQSTRDYKSLSHTKWDFKYPIVFIPKKTESNI